MKQEKRVNIFVNNVHDYDYVKERNDGTINHMLFYSKSDAWDGSMQETLAASIIDNGDGYQINGNARPSKKGEIDYHYAQQLEILLRLADLNIPNKYEMVEYKKVMF